ncbi:spore protease YyaC [Ammonifex thiophilus]|uniref:Spore protease YyaC n=1 Tax=Ammonifex thiophilus TaxID=444093 RepID=A0A3D8P5J2_9THEO|nr:spore protease YyaC [Ammonifex thiophilus]RDV84586.1 spore protease YyaC [Ammonifex thiophilus]
MEGVLDFTRNRVLKAQPRFRIHYGAPDASSRLAGELGRYLKPLLRHSSIPLVLLCIGTDRSTGDALGPLVGSQVAAASCPHYHVYGTLAEPVHAANLQSKLEEIYARHQRPFILAVDASLGKPESVGYINVGEGPIFPGAGVHKNLPPVGDLHITAVVNVGGFLEYLVLQNTRLNLVMQQAKVIAEALLQAVSAPCLNQAALG